MWNTLLFKRKNSQTLEPFKLHIKGKLKVCFRKMCKYILLHFYTLDRALSSVLLLNFPWGISHHSWRNFQIYSVQMTEKCMCQSKLLSPQANLPPPPSPPPRVLTINPEVEDSYSNSSLCTILWNLFHKQKEYSPILYDSLSVCGQFPEVFGQI